MTNTAHSLLTGVISPADSTDSANDAADGDASDKISEVQPGFGDAEKESKPKIDFLKDDISEMTYSRRLALKLMEKPWYYPQPEEKEEEEGTPSDSKNSAEDDEEVDQIPRVVEDFDKDITFEKPDLRKGWAFWEHQTLNRFLIPAGYDAKPKHSLFTRMYRRLFFHHNKKLEKAEPGENHDPSRLYPIAIPHSQLGDFGIGIGLYFSNMRALILISLLCGCISIANIVYFASDDYDYRNEIELLSFGTLFMAGSAACSANEWVPCPTCNCAPPFPRPEELFLGLNRCAVANNTEGEELIFGLKNECDGTRYFLIACNFATVVFMIFCMLILGKFMNHEEVKFDEDEQTAQDYSIQVKNPPPDAKDPEEWRSFFKDNLDGAQAVVCTCAVENDFLVKALVQRREVVRTIASLQPGESMDMLDLAKKAAQIKRERTIFAGLVAKVIPGIPECYDRLVSLKGRVEGQAQLEYPVTNVFVTFETEEDQRRVLENMCVGYTAAKKNDVNALSDQKYLFRGERVLDVVEPEEPSTIRWQDLNASMPQRLKEQAYTLVYTLVMLVLVFLLIYALNQKDPLWATYGISIVNVIFPQFAKVMTNKLETHQSETQKQASLYYKIVLFRWVTSTLIWISIIPFTDTITYGPNGLIERIYLQFFSDITVSNAVPLLDPMGHFQRHFLAPRAKTQDKMNIFFKGTKYELAERYTDMTKILFLGVFYCAIFPMAFFLCAITLTVKYFVDRFTLARSWQRASAIGPTISRISRQYFLSMAVGLMAISCSYYWTGFPFDNLCTDANEVDERYLGNFNMSEYPGFRGKQFSTQVTTATVSAGDLEYKLCSMDFMGNFQKVSFPFVPGAAWDVENLNPGEYMTKEQEISTKYFGWSAFALMLVILFRYFQVWYNQFQKLSKGGYKAIGESQGISYSKVTSRSAYIPQVSSNVFAFPLIACQIDNIDEELFDFKDPSRSYLYYDLTNDAEKLVADNKTEDLMTFTIVKSWPAEE